MKGFTNAINNSKDSIETLNVTLKTNQQEHTDLVGVGFTLSYGNYTKSFTWEGDTMTIEVPAYVTYTITYEGVEDYKKPEDVTFTAHGGNSRSITALYQTELVDVALNSSDGSSLNGAVVLINGKSRTWDGNNIKQKVAFGTEYSVEPQSLGGFTTPSSRSFVAEQAVREVSFTYIASALKVNILSNQSTDSSWDPTITNIKAAVSYDGASVEVSNGEQINLPSGVDVTISFPEVEGYKKPEDITFTHNGGLVEKSGTYQCELLTVNVSADQGSVSGFEVTISKQEVVGVATKYTRLEYIESNGTQYINTGFVPNQDTRLVMDCQVITHPSNGWSCLFGSRKTAENKSSYALWLNNSSLFAFYYSSSNSAFPSMGITERYLIEVNKNTATIGDKKITITYSNFDCVYPLYLSAVNSAGSLASHSSMRIYSCQIYDNGTLVRDYIPALRSDGIAGLYDAVNDTFYTSSGTGKFIAGVFEPTIVATQTTVTGSYKIPHDASYTVSANSVSGYTTPNPITRIASSISHVVEQKYEVIKVKDLSLFDIYGNPINRSTANCYVIREAGTYKFPCVYGNAIKNGKVNTAAFTNNGGSYSHDFVDGYNNLISQPYVRELSLAYVVLENIDHENIIEDVEIIKEDDFNGYIQFKVVNIPSEGANAIIRLGVTAGAKWSWHIWLWPHDLTPVEITNSTGVKYNIMPVNLASKYDSDGVHIKNWFYQWGRPNPMLLPSAWNSTTDHTPGSITKASKTNELWGGIQNPSTFYYNSSSPYNWFGTKSYYNLWDAACTGEGNSDNDTVKTVYDPCPVGWKVPNGNTFTGFSIINNANGIVKFTRYSGDSTGIGFPMSGYRRSSDGSLDSVGSYGYVWLSSAYSQSYAYSLYFGSSDVNPQSYSRRAIGFSVRPVQDDIIDFDSGQISFRIGDAVQVVAYCQGLLNMTWEAWINSTYNTYGYYMIDGYIYMERGSSTYRLCHDDFETIVHSSEIIENGGMYLWELI